MPIALQDRSSSVRDHCKGMDEKVRTLGDTMCLTNITIDMLCNHGSLKLAKCDSASFEHSSLHGPRFHQVDHIQAVCYTSQYIGLKEYAPYSFLIHKAHTSLLSGADDRTAMSLYGWPGSPSFHEYCLIQRRNHFISTVNRLKKEL